MTTNKITKQDASLIEVTPIRLSADETRAVCRMHRSKEPIVSNGYYSNYNSLVEMGVAEEVLIKSVGEESEAQAWKTLKLAVASKDLDLCREFVDKIRKAREMKDQKGYILTDFGKEIASGIAVRLDRGGRWLR